MPEFGARCNSVLRDRLLRAADAEPLADAFQPKRSEHFFQSFSCRLAWQTLELRDDEFIFYRMFPANQLGHGDRIAVGFEQQATQHVGNLAAEFAGVDRVPPELADAPAGCRLIFFIAQMRRDWPDNRARAR